MLSIALEAKQPLGKGWRGAEMPWGAKSCSLSTWEGSTPLWASTTTSIVQLNCFNLQS